MKRVTNDEGWMIEPGRMDDEEIGSLLVVEDVTVGLSMGCFSFSGDVLNIILTCARFLREILGACKFSSRGKGGLG